MNAVDDSGKEPEQHTPPTIEAGGEIEIDRNVPGTVDTTGFAQLRARCRERLELAKHKDKWSAAWTLIDVLSDIDAIEADAKSGS